ncbi:MAG: hypothetical protein ACFE7R_02135 [Candidatus Hodarchaeota archaeon]
MNKHAVLRKDPRLTASVLADIPTVLRKILIQNETRSTTSGKSILVSSNTLANKFILNQWGIRSSQRKRFKNLFSQVRKRCRQIFHHYRKQGIIRWENGEKKYLFAVLSYDEIRGNVILSFIPAPFRGDYLLRESRGLFSD